MEVPLHFHHFQGEVHDPAKTGEDLVVTSVYSQRSTAFILAKRLNYFSSKKTKAVTESDVEEVRDLSTLKFNG